MNNEINLNYYRSFFQVVSANGYTKASKLYFVAQPTLSYNVKKLEEFLGYKLIINNKNSIFLTNEGKILYEKLLKIDELFSKNDNKIIVGALKNVSDFCLDKIISEFHLYNPDIKFEIYIGDSGELSNKFYSNKLDILFDKIPFDNLNLNIEEQFFFKTDFCFACSRNYYLNNIDLFNDNTSFEKWPLFIPTVSKKRKKLFGILAKMNLQPNIVMEISSQSLLKNIILNDSGVGYFSSSNIKYELNNGDLIKLNIKDLLFDEFEEIGFIYYKDNISEPLKLFIEFLNNKKF